jgi:hypothetical protein
VSNVSELDEASHIGVGFAIQVLEFRPLPIGYRRTTCEMCVAEVSHNK